MAIKWDSVLDFIKGATPQGAIINAGEYASSAAITALKSKAQSWAKEVVNLNNTPMPDFLVPEKNALLSRASSIKNGVEKIFGVIPELNLSAVPALVVVGAVAVSTSTALIAKWHYDNDNLKQRYNAYMMQVKDGLSPTVAANNVYANTNKQTALGNVAKIMPYILIGGVLFIFRKQITKLIG